jgi:hypothetical protein
MIPDTDNCEYIIHISIAHLLKKGAQTMWYDSTYLKLQGSRTLTAQDCTHSCLLGSKQINSLSHLFIVSHFLLYYYFLLLLSNDIKELCT